MNTHLKILCGLNKTHIGAKHGPQAYISQLHRCVCHTLQGLMMGMMIQSCQPVGQRSDGVPAAASAEVS